MRRVAVMPPLIAPDPRVTLGRTPSAVPLCVRPRHADDLKP
jgi:hypothetical protein